VLNATMHTEDVWNWGYRFSFINPLNAELNAICHLLALLWAHHIFHVSRIRVNLGTWRIIIKCILRELQCECVDRTQRKQKTLQSVAVVHAVTTVGNVTNHQLLQGIILSGAYWFQFTYKSGWNGAKETDLNSKRQIT